MDHFTIMVNGWKLSGCSKTFSLVGRLVPCRSVSKYNVYLFMSVLYLIGTDCMELVMILYLYIYLLLKTKKLRILKTL